MRDYLAAFRTMATAPPARPGTPKGRTITFWTLRHPDDLDTDQQLALKQVLAALSVSKMSSVQVSRVTW